MPPRRCGIALYTRDLIGALVTTDVLRVDISWVPVVDTSPSTSVAPVLSVLRGPDDTAESAVAAAGAVNQAKPDLVWLQHEFGLYGRWRMPYRDALRFFLEALERPLITTMHTVLSRPASSVRHVVQCIGRLSSRLVVMSSQGARVLHEEYDIPRSRVSVIPHGVTAPAQAPGARSRRHGDLLIVSFGFISPGKGLDNVIRAMRSVLARWPGAMYVIAGQSHPSPPGAASAAHHAMLRSRAAELDVGQRICFVDRFLPDAELDALLARADLVVLANLDPQQVSSGTLARALGAGCAVVATPNGHSRDVAAHGAIRLLEGASPDQIAQAITDLLDRPERLALLRERARCYAEATSWPVVARRSARLLASALQDA